MATNHLDAPPASSPSTQAPPPAKGNPVRLAVLLGVLAVVLGALAYDYLVARPGVQAADERIEKMVTERNKKGVREADLVRSEDIQKEIGFAPTWVEENDKDGHTTEYYCWWGKVPYLNKKRHFIAVVYVGGKPRHYSAHYREVPPEEAYPIPASAAREQAADQSLPAPQAADAGPRPASDQPAKPAEDQPAKAAEDQPAKAAAEEPAKAAEEKPGKAKEDEPAKARKDEPAKPAEAKPAAETP